MKTRQLISFRLDPDLIQVLKEEAERREVSLTELVEEKLMQRDGRADWVLQQVRRLVNQ